MQIVIEIPDEMYKEYVSVNLGRSNGKTITYNLLKAIKDGTPLPKGHGRLIDADAIKYNYFMYPETDNPTKIAVSKDKIDDMPPIIEADGGGEDGDSN